MKNLIWITAFALVLTGCISNDTAVKEAIRNNPKIVFDVIEENPEQFMESVNRAAVAARQKEQSNRAAKAKAQQDQELKSPKQPKLDSARRLIGKGSEEIVIVEYADFQCPACRYAYESLLAFKKKYKGNVQFYFKHMPLSFHKEAMPAAMYMEAVRLQGVDKAYKFYEYVFQRQDQLGSPDFLKKAAKESGADLKRLEKDLKSDELKKIVAADMQEFEAFGFTGTPTVMVNGVSIPGAPRLEDLVQIVEATVK